MPCQFRGESWKRFDCPATEIEKWRILQQVEAVFNHFPTSDRPPAQAAIKNIYGLTRWRKGFKEQTESKT